MNAANFNIHDENQQIITRSNKLTMKMNNNSLRVPVYADGLLSACILHPGAKFNTDCISIPNC